MASLPRSHRESISAAQRARFLELVEAGEQAELEKRKCSTCGDYKRLEEFYRTKEKLKSGLVAIRPDCRCKECRRAQARDRYHRQIREGVDIKARRARYRKNEDAKRRRAREREYKAMKRREEGKPEAGPRVRAAEPYQSQQSGPVEPIRQFLLQRLSTETQADISAATGLSPRRLFAIIEREYPTVRLATVDKLLAGLGCPEELNTLYPLKEEKLIGYHYLDPEGVLDPPTS